MTVDPWRPFLPPYQRDSTRAASRLCDCVLGRAGDWESPSGSGTVEATNCWCISERPDRPTSRGR